jgi:GAF domain-containing protein
VFVVPDVDEAPEFRDAQWLKGGDHVRFYAGYPLEAPGGERVGALCVMNRTPRPFGPADISMLRDLALRAQRELWLAAS